MELASQNLQGAFLEQLRNAQAPVTVFLVNGIKLQGVIIGFDDATLELIRDGHAQLVYKHAISTVMPLNPLSSYSDER